MNKSEFTFSPEVESSLRDNKPVVALESTVIAHGLPHPHNLQTARRVEQIVRDEGAVPATIAILNGGIRVGLDDEELQFIAAGADIKKVSMRDLSIAVAQKSNGATTVATTSWVAERAGIKVFSTGGIGGVHRGTQTDVSADLPILASTSIIVVCSGAKIVLDLPATREWLETHGVAVVGFRCDEMPAFYSTSSGLPVDIRVETVEEVVKLFRVNQNLKLKSALLVTVAVPAESAIPQAELNETLATTLREAEQHGISGREVTPFLLAGMARTSKGSTLKANIALLENNARVAAAIARELHR